MTLRAKLVAPAFSAVILAGGRSARMGQPKATLRFGGAMLLERTITELKRQFDDIVVVAAPAAAETFPVKPVIDQFERVTLLRDASAFGGPAGALRTGLLAARHDRVFACSCDLPLLDAEVARALCGMLGEYDAVIPEAGGRPHPLHAAYRRRAADALSAMEAGGERRLT
ncbi:MAG: molybdenum cofactor guanylyltransferase, partial [Candidatus Binataceae bacterium]